MLTPGDSPGIAPHYATVPAVFRCSGTPNPHDSQPVFSPHGPSPHSGHVGRRVVTARLKHPARHRSISMPLPSLLMTNGAPHSHLGSVASIIGPLDQARLLKSSSSLKGPDAAPRHRKPYHAARRNCYDLLEMGREVDSYRLRAARRKSARRRLRAAACLRRLAVLGFV